MQSYAQDFLKYWDILCFVEAAIYSIDEENEQLAGAGALPKDHSFKGAKEFPALPILTVWHVTLKYQLAQAAECSQNHLESKLHAPLHSH